MNLQCIQYFLEIANCGNFTKAAERLYITQPTLSRQIADLENELGVKLFNRQGRAVTLTAAGQIFRREAIEITTRCNNLPAMIRKETLSVVGSVTIGLQNTLDTHLLAAVLQSISKQYPEINIVLNKYDFGPLTECLRKNQADIVITLTSLLPPIPEIAYHKLQNNTLALAVSVSHPLANSTEPIHINDLANESFVLADRSISPATVDCVIKLCMNAGFSPRTISYCQDPQLILLNVSANRGIGFIFDQAYNPYPDLVKIIRIADETPDFDMVLAYRKSTVSLAAKMVIDEFLQLAPQDVE